MRLVLIALAVILFGVAAFSIWAFFQRPDSYVWLVTAAASGIGSLVLPSLVKRMSPEKERAWRQDGREGIERNITGRER